MPSSHFIWNVSPELFSLGPLSVRWYGVFFALSFYLGLYLFQGMLKRDGIKGFNDDRLLTHFIIGTLVGARLGHCLFYDPDYFLSNPMAILRIWEGGLASHGGVIGIFIALFLFFRKPQPVSAFWLCDRLALISLMGSSFIRLGNFFNSEIIGHASTAPWAIIFAQSNRYGSQPHHPSQLYECLGYGLSFIIFFMLYRKTNFFSHQGRPLGAIIVTIFTLRFFLEFYKTQQASYELTNSISVGQWLSLPFILAGIIIFAKSFLSSPSTEAL